MPRGRRLYPDLQTRLLANSYEYDGHWLWLGHCTADGYGRVQVYLPSLQRAMPLFVHRASYAAFIGPIPAGHDIDHMPKCPFRHCLHPNCLRPLPYREHRAMTGWKKANPAPALSL